jgi:hypothetical protein
LELITNFWYNNKTIIFFLINKVINWKNKFRLIFQIYQNVITKPIYGFRSRICFLSIRLIILNFSNLLIEELIKQSKKLLIKILNNKSKILTKRFLIFYTFLILLFRCLIDKFVYLHYIFFNINIWVLFKIFFNHFIIIRSNVYVIC